MASITSSILGTGLGVYQAIDGAKRKREAMNELDAYKRQELDNAYEDMSLSLEGNDLLRDENARASAGIIDAASNAGSRAIIGAAPRVSAAVNNLNTAAARNLDDQNNRIEFAIAGDNARIEGLTEARDNANIAALSSEANAGRQDTWNGMLGAASGLGYLARSYVPAEREDANELQLGTPNGVTPASNIPITATPLPGSSPYMNPTPPTYRGAGPSPYNPFAGFPTSFNPYY